MISYAVESIQTVAEKVIQGDWFFAVSIKGEDGHNKIDLAISRGAVGVTTELGHIVDIPPGIGHEVVLNLRQALFEKAKQKRSELKTQVAVIAGSNGKTTVKEMVVSILRETKSPFGFNPENQNTKIALATALLRLPREASFAVFEVGARRTNDFQIPIQILAPDVVALLNIGSAHVGEFGSPENLRNEKLSILLAPTARALIIPKSDSAICAFAEKTQKTIRRFDRDNFDYTYRAPASDVNFAAARTVAESLGISEESISRGFENFQGVPRRFQQIRIGRCRVIDDAFNSSLESARAGLEEVSRIASGAFDGQKILLVLGSMLELGQETKSAHQALGQFIVQHRILKSATVLTIGEEAYDIAPHAANYVTVDTAFSRIKAELNSYDIVYFKASRSIGFEKLIGRLQ